jgi:SAM-dependent methyltransferase
VASVRLDVLASVFGPTSTALLGDVPPGDRRIVLDLGCGPGHTTVMLASAFPGAQVLGIDSSPAFVAEASAAGAPGCRYAVADVTRPPLPGAPADVIYSRFLVVHLADPRAALAMWAGQLRPGGVLVVEEPEHIDTDDGDFRRYLELASAMVADRGGDLYAGRLLAEAPPIPSTTAVVHRCAPLDVPAGRAATIFALNLSTWAGDEALASVASPGETAELAARLERRRGDSSTGVIGWGMRQLVLERSQADADADGAAADVSDAHAGGVRTT